VYGAPSAAARPTIKQLKAVALRFNATTDPSGDLVRSISLLSPANPFYTRAYVSARASLGDIPCTFDLRTEAGIAAGCAGFLRGGFLQRSLEITSLPRLPAVDLFWEGLRDFCRKHSVWDLFVDSFGSEEAAIPCLAPEIRRRRRWEYILDLNQGDVSVSNHHRRNIARAHKSDLRLRRTRDADAILSHANLVNASMERRNGHDARGVARRDDAVGRALLRAEAGELFQAMIDETIVSSVLVLRSKSGAYYQSAGTSAEGMSRGASPFLICEVATALKREGIEIFNLGGAAPENPGLQRFKKGFGAREVTLEAAAFSMVSPVKRRLRAALKALHDHV